MLELWADFRMLLADNGRTSLSRMYVSGALALTRKAGATAAEIHSVLHQALPEVIADVQRLHRRRPYAHWSGKGRRQAIADACGPQYADLYEFLSWDTHPVVQILLDGTVMSAQPTRAAIRHRTPQADVAKRNCLTAVDIITDMWNSLCARVGSYAARPARSRPPNMRLDPTGPR
jgi:hypothetical protein